MPVGQVHLSVDRTGDGEVHVHVRLGGHVLEIDGGVVLVLRLGQVEGELVVDGQVVEAAGVDWVAEVVILGVALLAVVAGDALGRAETVTRPVVIMMRMMKRIMIRIMIRILIRMMIRTMTVYL